jgi:hypothetical protein
VPFGEDLKLSAVMILAIPPENIGGLMTGEAAELIVRIVRDRGRPGP